MSLSVRRSMELIAATPLMRGAVGGLAYGLAVAAVSHPFDTLKCRRQATPHAPPATHRRRRHSSASAALAARAAAVRSLYRGVIPAATASMVLRAVPFIGYEAATAYLRRRHSLFCVSVVLPPLLIAFLGGVAGGVMRGILETPSEVMKTREQLGIDWHWDLSLLDGIGATVLRTGAWLLTPQKITPPKKNGFPWQGSDLSSLGRLIVPCTKVFLSGGGGVAGGRGHTHRLQCFVCDVAFVRAFHLPPPPAQL